MSVVGFVSNFNPHRNYSYFKRQDISITYITSGTELNVESIAQVLAQSKHNDVLILDGNATISAVCLAMWLELHGDATIYEFKGDIPAVKRISRTSIRRMIERAADEVNHGR